MKILSRGLNGMGGESQRRYLVTGISRRFWEENSWESYKIEHQSRRQITGFTAEDGWIDETKPSVPGTPFPYSTLPDFFAKFGVLGWSVAQAEIWTWIKSMFSSHRLGPLRGSVFKYLNSERQLRKAPARFFNDPTTARATFHSRPPYLSRHKVLVRYDAFEPEALVRICPCCEKGLSASAICAVRLTPQMCSFQPGFRYHFPPKTLGAKILISGFSPS